MNPALLLGLRSLRVELFVVMGIVLCILALPIIVSVSLLGSGLSSVSSALVQREPTTRSVTLTNPDGAAGASVTLPRQWPTHGIVTLEFGESDAPYQIHHTGIDIANIPGTTVASFAPGFVTQTGRSISQGNFIVIDHGQGITSRYLHLSRIMVSKKQQVSVGTQIGSMGSTGYSTGPHLHFEIRVAQIPVNPRSFLEGNP